MLQAFKESDVKEKRVRNIALPILTLLGNVRTEFFLDAFFCHELGRVLYRLRASPLAGVIDEDSFARSFSAIHELFTRPGTFEFYMDVFRAVWGESVEVEFVVPAPGKLEINITALDALLENFFARRIENDAYFYDEVVDHVGDNLVFQSSQGLKTQEETDALMVELQPDGLYITTTLIIA